MSRLDQPGVLDTLERRLAILTPDTPRRWGKMSAHEMVCHLSDSFRATLGEREASPAPSNAVQRQVMRLLALHTPLAWPKGVPTRPEVNPHDKGSRPVAFEGDRADLAMVMRRFARSDAAPVVHPIFGTLSRREWMIWAFRHVDHHFRQFGV